MPKVALTRRRTLLAGAALGGVALLTGCSEDSGPDRTEHSSAAERLRERSARDSTTLLARYDATLAAHPSLEPRLRPLRAEVARHAEAFGKDRAAPSPEGDASDGPAREAGAPASGPAPHGSQRPSGPQVPRDERAARAALADAERKLSDVRTKALTGAPPELARLLASVAAAGAAHAYLLAERAG
ncbi:lipoprotein [Streptomyces caniferus]|uniref:Lipoprotein n=1 Tax=Streptomyces caniferus TaxID=285557 RepID=A0A640S3S1_9ACTN|nr:lipoprotein [Streptomyces caniferus]